MFHLQHINLQCRVDYVPVHKMSLAHLLKFCVLFILLGLFQRYVHVTKVTEFDF
jgi:hypothetical protein